MWIKNNYKLIIIYIISTIPFLKWLTNGTFVAGDLKYYPAGYYERFLDLFAWISYTGFGGQNDVLSRFFKDIIGFSISAFFSLDSNAGNIFMLYTPYLLSGFLAVYFLVKYLKATDIFLLSFIVFTYVFNTYFLASNSQGHFLLPISFNFGLVSFVYLLIRGKNLSVNTIIISLLILTVSATFDFRFAYLFFIINSLYILYLKRFSKYIFLYVFIFVLTQLYWIYPFLYSYDQSRTVGRPLFGGQFWGLINAFVGYHPFWNEGKIIQWFQANSVPYIQLLLMALLIYIGIVKVKSRVYITWFLFYLIFVFLAKLDNEPFSHIYGLLYQYLPGFNAFRESSKFYPFVTISFIVIISLYYLEVKNRNFMKSVIVLLILATLPSYLGILSGSAGEIYKKEHIPASFNSREFLSLTGNLVWFPSKPTFSHNNINAKNLSWNNHLKKDIKDYQLSKSEIDIYNLDYLIVPGDLPFDFNYSIYGTTKSLIKNNVEEKIGDNKYYDDGYISIYKLRDRYAPDFRSESALVFNKRNPSLYSIDISLNKKIEELKFLQSFHPEWKLYLEPYISPDCTARSITYTGTVDVPTGHMYSDAIYVVEDGDDYELIAGTYTGLTVSMLEQLNPDIDSLALEVGTELMISQPTSITQTESYNVTDCSSNQQSISILDDISKIWEQPIFDDTHKIVYDYANQWTIDPEYIRANYPREYYQENPDGTIDVRMTLYFRPQSYFYLGLIISGLTLLGCVGYLALYRLRNRPRQQ